MKTTHKQILIAVALVGAMAFTSAFAQQVPLPKTAAEVPGPAAGTAMTKEYVQMVGRMAYVWGWPMVNSHNRRASFASATVFGSMHSMTHAPTRLLKSASSTAPSPAFT